MSCKKIILYSVIVGVAVSVLLSTVNMVHEAFFPPSMTFGQYYTNAMILAWPSSLMFISLAGREATFFAYEIYVLAVALNAILYSLPGVAFCIFRECVRASASRRTIHTATRLALYGLAVAVSLFTVKTVCANAFETNELFSSIFNALASILWPLSSYVLQFGSPADIMGRPLSVDLAIPIYATVYLFGTNMVLYGLAGWLYAAMRNRYNRGIGR